VRRAIALALVALGVVVSCTIMNGYSADQPDAGAPPPPDAPAAPEAAADADLCPHALPPEPPADEGGPPGAFTFVTTAKSVSLGAPEDGGLEPPFGFDLDHTCTCEEGQGSSCVPPPGADVCDQPNGIDDAVRELVATAEKFEIHFTHDLNDNIVTGANSILLWVDGYNGAADDPAVNVAVLYSPGLYGDAGQNLVPSFTTDDAWSVTSDEVVPMTKGPVSVAPGFVRDGTLVVRTHVKLGLLPGVTIDLPDALLVGRIGTAGNGVYFVADGVVAGRGPAAPLIRALGSKEQPPRSGKRLCTNPDYAVGFAIMGQRICAGRDIMTDPADDGKGKACDAISVTLKFEGAPASIGPIRDVDGGPACADAEVPCP
jgi:hypothetical protein